MSKESHNKSVNKYKKNKRKQLVFDLYEKDYDLFYKFQSVPGKTKNDKLRYLLKDIKDFDLTQQED